MSLGEERDLTLVGDLALPGAMPGRRIGRAFGVLEPTLSCEKDTLFRFP